MILRSSTSNYIAADLFICNISCILCALFAIGIAIALIIDS
jgi:uncharacterized membrane protein YciS (DUF1049 family)